MGMFEYCKISVSLYLFNISVLLRFVGLVFCFILYCYCIRSWQRFAVVFLLNPLSANPTKWSNLRKLPTNCLSVFDHFVGLALKELNLRVSTEITFMVKLQPLTSLLNYPAYYYHDSCCVLRLYDIWSHDVNPMAVLIQNLTILTQNFVEDFSHFSVCNLKNIECFDFSRLPK